MIGPGIESQLGFTKRRAFLSSIQMVPPLGKHFVNVHKNSAHHGKRHCRRMVPRSVHHRVSSNPSPSGVCMKRSRRCSRRDIAPLLSPPCQPAFDGPRNLPTSWVLRWQWPKHAALGRGNGTPSPPAPQVSSKSTAQAFLKPCTPATNPAGPLPSVPQFHRRGRRGNGRGGLSRAESESG